MADTSAERIAAAVFFAPPLTALAAPISPDRVAAIWREAMHEEPDPEDVLIAA